MAIDFEKETLLSMTEAARTLPALDGKRVHSSAVWRWCRKGVRGVHLDYMWLGRRMCTSREALGRFAQALADCDSAPEEQAPRSYRPRQGDRTPAQRATAIEEAERELRKAGI